MTAPARIKRVVELWRNHAAVSIASAHLGSQPLGRPGVTIHPLKRGPGFVMVVWRGERSADDTIEQCITAGGRCRSKTKRGAIAEGVRLLLDTYPP